MELEPRERLTLLMMGIAILYFLFVQFRIFGLAGLVGTAIAMAVALGVLVALRERG